MGLSHSGATPLGHSGTSQLESPCSSSDSNSDLESSSEEDTEGDLITQDNAAVLDTGLDVGTSCSSQQGAESKRLSEQPPSASGCSLPGEVGELSQELLEPSSTMFEPLDQHRPGERNGGTLDQYRPGERNGGTLDQYRPSQSTRRTSFKHDGLSVQELQNSSGEVGSSDGSDTDSGEEVEGGRDKDEGGDASCEASPSEDLQNLSLQNKRYWPHRDKRERGETTPQTLTAAASIGESDQGRIRLLVKRTVAKKRKQQQRHLRPNRVTNNSTAVRRSKKSSRRAVTQDGFW